MSASKRVLILYYSLTHQTENVLNMIRVELEAGGHSVDMRRIQPVTEWTLPLDKPTFFYNWTKVWLGMNLNQPIHHIPLKSEDYDYIILGFQPWNLAPSIPVNSFLDSEMAEIFRGKKVIGVVTCRQRWERSFRIAKTKVEKRGGKMVDGFVIVNYEKEPYNLVTTVYQLFEGHEPPKEHWLSRFFKPYGIGKDSLRVAQDYGKELAERLREDRLDDLRGWRIVDQPLSLV